MLAFMTYKEQIRSPEWIKFSAKIKEAHNWCCKACGQRQGPDSELTIHHIYYLKGVKMWEHPESLLECLCWECHKKRQSMQQDLLAYLGEAMKDRGTESLDKSSFLSFLYTAAILAEPRPKIIPPDSMAAAFSKGITRFTEEFPEYLSACQDLTLDRVESPDYMEGGQEWTMTAGRHEDRDLLASRMGHYRMVTSVHEATGIIIEPSIRARGIPWTRLSANESGPIEGLKE